MTDTARLTIGQLARRTGLSVRTIRFYSDSGVVPEADRSEAGYRLYDVEALARLELVRTLRDLGIDLPAIRRVLAREADLADVAATHAAALDAEIRTLRLRRAVLRAVARRGSEHEEIELMHKLAALSDEERRRIIEDFLDEVFHGVEAHPGLVAQMRAAQPDLPDDPSPEQVEAWIELAELVQDRDFRRTIRGMAERHATDPGASSDGVAANPVAAKVVVRRGGEALAQGIAPASAEARAVVDAILGEIGEPADRLALADRIDAFADARAERYWQLLAVINGWPQAPATVPAWEWFAAALRASADGRAAAGC